jgi:hypothetical protein
MATDGNVDTEHGMVLGVTTGVLPASSTRSRTGAIALAILKVWTENG